jgi:Spy/CpxP family protein refolding chaperone
MEDPIPRAGHRVHRLASGVSAALAATLLLATAAGAFGPGGFGPGGEGGRLERAVEGLNLDASTRAKAFAVIDSARPASRSLRSSLMSAHQQLRSLLDQTNVSEDAVDAQIDQLASLQGQLRKQEVHTLLQVRALLTPDQQAQLSQALQPRRGGRFGPPAAEP